MKLLEIKKMTQSVKKVQISFDIGMDLEYN